jgi:hypothetical protein
MTYFCNWIFLYNVWNVFWIWRVWCHMYDWMDWMNKWNEMHFTSTAVKLMSCVKEILHVPHLNQFCNKYSTNLLIVMFTYWKVFQGGWLVCVHLQSVMHPPPPPQPLCMVLSVWLFPPSLLGCCCVTVIIATAIVVVVVPCWTDWWLCEYDGGDHKRGTNRNS